MTLCTCFGSIHKGIRFSVKAGVIVMTKKHTSLYASLDELCGQALGRALWTSSVDKLCGRALWTSSWTSSVDELLDELLDELCGRALLDKLLDKLCGQALGQALWTTFPAYALSPQHLLPQL